MTHTTPTPVGPRLFDYDTAEDLGPATFSQIAASDAKVAAGFADGAFLIDAAGGVISIDAARGKAYGRDYRVAYVAEAGAL